MGEEGVEVRERVARVAIWEEERECWRVREEKGGRSVVVIAGEGKGRVSEGGSSGVMNPVGRKVKLSPKLVSRESVVLLLAELPSRLPADLSRSLDEAGSTWSVGAGQEHLPNALVDLLLPSSAYPKASLINSPVEALTQLVSSTQEARLESRSSLEVGKGVLRYRELVEPKFTLPSNCRSWGAP